jgi:predicted transcriptional regulator
MAREKLVPISFYLPKELHDKLKIAGANRKQSMLIRNAIQMIIDNNSSFNSGYNQGLKDSIEVITSNEDAMTISISNRTIGMTIVDDIKTLEKSNDR